MLPLLPFVAGIATGALVLKLWRTDKSKLKLDEAQEKIRSATDTAQKKLRNVTASGLEAIEQSSAKMRKRLSAEGAPIESAAAAPDVVPVAPKVAAKKAKPKKPVAPKTEVAA